MHKDLGLALAAAEAAGLTLPLSASVERVYASAAEMGLADEDFLATVKVVEASLGGSVSDGPDDSGATP